MTILEKIQSALEKVRPGLQMDGGDVEFVSFDEASGVVTVALQGVCTHCPMAEATIKNYIEAEVKAEVPEVSEVRGA